MMGATRSPHDIRNINSEAEVATCFPLMRQLRPHLASEQDFVARWCSQARAGYRLIALWRDDVPVALAGFRLQENLFHGMYFYIDDLVTDADARCGGYGRVMMDRLKAEARTAGCTRLVLDTPLTNVLGHRFYFRHGLLARALRFSIDLTDAT